MPASILQAGGDAVDKEITECRASLQAELRSSVKGERRLSFTANIDNAHVKSWQTYTRFMLAACAWFYLQDNVLDVIVAWELYERQHEVWALLMVIFIFLPVVMLVCVNFQLKRYKHAAAALVGLSIYLEMKESWAIGVETRDLIRETDVHMIFQTIPQFVIQSQLILQSHYLAKRCEETFDVVCAEQCTAVPGMQHAEFSRFTCSREPATSNCWDWYGRCIASCPAMQLLKQKIEAEEAYVKAWMSLKPGAITDAKAQKRKASERFQEAMEEDSQAWARNYCDAQASGLTELVDPRTGAIIQTLRRSVFLLWMQLPALMSAGLTIALSRAFRTVDERSDYNIAVVSWVMQLASFGFHFLFDIFAVAGSISLYYAATNDAYNLRIVAGLVIVAVFQLTVRRKGIYEMSHWSRRILAGFAYILMSPLARLPACKPLRAEQVRALLRLRVAMQIGLSVVGFIRLTSHTSNKSEFQKELALSVFMIAFAVLFTNTPGTSTVWTAQWDVVTRRFLMAKDLVKFDNRSKFRALRCWKAYIKSEKLIHEWEEHLNEAEQFNATEARWDPYEEDWCTFTVIVDRYKDDAPLEEIAMFWELECLPQTQGNILTWMEDETDMVFSKSMPAEDMRRRSVGSIGMAPTASTVSTKLKNRFWHS
eukprot:SRR837773.16115.p1 GENE.SRR837773.16115~~SRR837773.16115.p1  ORF type:complete len:652 (-),score=135.56 SRR837773.16115:18-1973(-)